MLINKKLVDLILKKRKGALRDFILGEDSLELDKLRPDLDKLIKHLDTVFYTLNFLKNKGLIKIIENSNSVHIDLFQGFSVNNEFDVYGAIFIEQKVRESYSWHIEQEPGLIVFQKNNYKTDRQVREKINFWLPIVVAILTSFLTAIFGFIFQSTDTLYFIFYK